MLCCWVEDPNSEAFKLHLPRIQDYLWIAEDGMKMQVWDHTVPSHILLLEAVHLYTNQGLDFEYRHMTNLMQGYNGSQLWDTAFAVQAIMSTNLIEEFGPTLKKGHMYIKKSQVKTHSFIN